MIEQRVSGPSVRRAVAGIVGAVLLALPLASCSNPPEATANQASAMATSTASTAAETAPSSARAAGPRFKRVSRRATRPGRGRMKLVYTRVSSNERRELESALKESKLFEETLESLNQGLVLPANVEVRFKECGEENAFYDSNEKAIELCYELFEHYLDSFAKSDPQSTAEEVGTKAAAAMIFTFYHELGHALVDVYDLPITGREEDAVDQLATVMLLETWDGEDSELAILSSAEWYDVGAGEAEEHDMADEHSLDEQRYYNLVCWIYGSDPEYFSDVANEWGLPPARAQQCEGEYARMSNAWNTLLGPHMLQESTQTGP